MKYTRGNDKTVFIRYANRKLYNTESGKYVNLTYIESLPKDSFTVIEYNTKKDVTTVISLRAEFNTKLNNALKGI